jgi:hypothetical protein
VRIRQKAHPSCRSSLLSSGAEQMKPSVGTQLSGERWRSGLSQQICEYDGRPSMRLNEHNDDLPHCRLFRPAVNLGGIWQAICEKATSRPGSKRAAGYAVSSSSSVRRRTERSTSHISAGLGSAGSTRCRPTVASPIAFIGISIGYCALSETSSDTLAQLPSLSPAIRTCNAFGLCCSGSVIQTTARMRGKMPSLVECQRPPTSPDPGTKSCSQQATPCVKKPVCVGASADDACKMDGSA